MFSQTDPACVERSYALFDIGASSIGAALAVRTRAGARILWASRLEYAFKDAPDYERYQRSMYAALLEAGMALTTEGAKFIRSEPSFSMRSLTAVAVLGPPWYLATVRTGVKAQDKPFEVTHGVLDTLRGAMFDEFLKDPASASWREVTGSPELLEQFETSVRLDGYRVENYERRRTHELVQASYLALASQPVVEQVRTILQRVLPNHDTRMTTSTRLLGNLFNRRAPADIGRAVLVELGGPITSVAMFGDRVPTGVLTIPHGIHTMLNAVAPNAASAAEARSKIIPLKRAASGEADDIPEPVERTRTEWHEEVTRAIHELSRGITPPRDVVLVAPDSWYPIYAPTLERAWTMPGVRRSVSMRVLPLELNEGGESPESGSDGRLRYLLHAVDECVASHK